MVGVDHRTQNRYPGKYIKADVFEVLEDDRLVRSFDFWHWSPPCQIFSKLGNLPQNHSGKVDLLRPAFKIIEERFPDMIHIVENVEAAPMYHPNHQCLKLCGSMFGLMGFSRDRYLQRHRKFRLYNLRVPVLRCSHKGRKAVGVYGSAGDDIPNGALVASFKEGKKLMGIDWMSWREMREAVPPAYTEYIGKSLVQTLDAQALFGV